MASEHKHKCVANLKLWSAHFKTAHMSATHQFLVREFKLLRLSLIRVGLNKAREDVSPRTKAVLVPTKICLSRLDLLLQKRFDRPVRFLETLQPMQRETSQD